MSEKDDRSVSTQLRPLGCALGLSGSFLLIYGACLALAAHRNAVPSLYFGWELRIPLVPAMIVPYWSIDLLFIASFFFCRDDRELLTLSLRLAMAQLVAALFFMLFPVRLAYPRPEVSGFFGTLVDLTHSADMPFNCAPSLHVATTVILAAVFLPRLRGLARYSISAWLALVVASTLLTWQHHVLDIVTGAVLGLGCLWVFPKTRAVTPVQGVLAPPRIISIAVLDVEDSSARITSSSADLGAVAPDRPRAWSRGRRGFAGSGIRRECRRRG